MFNKKELIIIATLSATAVGVMILAVAIINCTKAP